MTTERDFSDARISVRFLNHIACVVFVEDFTIGFGCLGVCVTALKHTGTQGCGLCCVFGEGMGGKWQ